MLPCTILGYMPPIHSRVHRSYTLYSMVNVPVVLLSTVMRLWAQPERNPWVGGSREPQDSHSCYSCYGRMRRILPLFLLKVDKDWIAIG